MTAKAVPLCILSILFILSNFFLVPALPGQEIGGPGQSGL
jgi:hypothetical protein